VTFLDLHVLQTVPPSNINRDESGSPKTAIYGGSMRARVSSQAWKRAVRLAFEADPQTAREAGRRTKKIPQVIGDALASQCPDLAPTTDLIGLKAAAAMFKIKAAAPKKPAKDGEPAERPITQYLLFLGDDQLARVTGELAIAHAALAAAGFDEAKVEKTIAGLGLDRLGVTGHPGAVALFGRMIANSPDTNVDAACQVAHALSTHAVAPEFDYFTAVDDNPDPDSKGAGMVGVIEFNSATLYRYASVSMRDLIGNLDGDADHALNVAMSFARSFITAMPSGKRSTFANSTRPDFVLLSIRDDQPVSLIGAFEKPVRTENGLVAESCARLLRYRGEQDDLYGTTPVQEAFVYPQWLASDIRDRGIDSLPNPATLPAALTRTRDELVRLVAK
jgi:CRISPR system Cascade subunit CasC